MQTSVVRRERLGFRIAPVCVVLLACMFSFAWFLAGAGQAFACSCIMPGSPTEELEKFDAVFVGRVFSVEHSYSLEAKLVNREDHSTIGFEVSTVGRVLSMKSRTSRHRQRAGVAATRSWKARNTSSTPLTATMVTTAIRRAFAAARPSSAQRKQTLTRSERVRRRKPGQKDQRLRIRRAASMRDGFLRLCSRSQCSSWGQAAS